MSRLVVVDRVISVSTGQGATEVADRRVIPYESIRSFVIYPVIEERIPHVFSAASLAALEADEVPETVINKVATIQDEQFLGEESLIAGLKDANVSEEEWDSFGAILLTHVEKGPSKDALIQVIAYLDLSTGKSGLSSSAQATSSAGQGIIPIALVLDLAQLTQFYGDMDAIKDKMADPQNFPTIEIVYRDYV